MNQPLNDALLLALVLRLTIQGRGGFVRSCSDSNVGSDSLRSKTVYSFMAELDRLAYSWEAAFKVGAVTAVTKKNKRQIVTWLSKGTQRRHLLDFVSNTLIFHAFEHSLTFCNVLPN